MNRKDDNNLTETVHLTARVPSDLAEALSRIAEAEDRTLSAEMRRALRAYVDAVEAAAAA